MTTYGAVEWTGENPGIMLKNDPEGPFVSLASFFRVTMSPHGRGHALVLLQSPSDAASPADRGNFCLTDNEPLARYLVSDFVAHFGSFKGLPGLETLQYRPLDTVEASGDPRDSYAETVRAGGTTVKLVWSGLGAPFFFVLPPEKSATGRHHMPSVFVGCREAAITVDGKRLPGRPVPRVTEGHEHSSAILAFSEAWIRV